MAYTKKDWVSGELITEAALDNMENGIKDNDTAITAHAGDIATVETTNRASRAYSIGEFLLYNNRLYIVTAAIASGGTITVGTNVSATSVGDQLETLNTNFIYRPGDRVAVQVCFIGKATNAKDGYFGTIPVPKAMSTSITGATFTDTQGFGQWFSDGASHTIDYASLQFVERHANMLWCKLPASNIDSSASIAWVRLDTSIQFS